MINLYIVLSIMFLHWVFDFIFQTHEDATNKSTSELHLLSHTSIYSLAWVIPITIYASYTGLWSLMFFIPITFVTHTITDYYTSKLNSYLYKKGDIHNFFVSVGFDQWLHTVQLLLTFYLLT